MTARSIRRAQERKTRKLARKQAVASVSEPRLPVAEPTASVSGETEPARLNLQPCATRTGTAVLLPSGDATSYERHVEAYHREFHPATLIETALVQSAADAHWRILRYQSIEMAFYARGRSEFAARFEQEDPAARPALCDLETFVIYGKQLRQLQLQENRLHRQREKDLAELRTLQDARVQGEEEDAFEAGSPFSAIAGSDCKPRNPPEPGFEFSTKDEAALFSKPKIQHAAALFTEPSITI